MYKDPLWKDTEEKVENALETYTLEEILEQNDITVEEALTHLVMNGIIDLPKIVTVR